MTEKKTNKERQPATVPTQPLRATAPIKGPAARMPTAKYHAGLLVVTVLAFATRFYRLNEPDEVVFDEVHFGKFASYYLRGTYFFDLHPPFAKIMIALIGKLVGYDGGFLFDSIGNKYATSGAPYLAYRSWCALLGSLVVPVLFTTLKECGFSVASCLLGASLVVFDSAEITETRLILLDSTLLLSIACSVYSYVRFSKLRSQPFTVKWWKWLLLTGVALSCVISTKYVGVFTFFMLGGAVIVDLWRLLDISRGLTLVEWLKQFVSRFFALIAVPLTIYLFWFWLHFEMLPKSGPGDDFMTASFKETLAENPAVKEAMDVSFYDQIRIRNKVGVTYLHSHLARYPLQYPDGRVSTQGQQVTGYGSQDPNNVWEILPPMDIPVEERTADMTIIGSQVVRLRHVATDSYLLTHDVASPGFPTNEEVTTVPPDQANGARYNDTLFTLSLSHDPSSRVRSKLSMFRLNHVPTKVAIWMSDKALPDWGFDQVEINGSKDLVKAGTEWFIDDVTNVEDKDSRRTSARNSERKHISFFKKYWELQRAMFRSNNNLKDVHPYQSSPLSWPLLTSGVSFWTQDSTVSQIYFIGNYFSYYIELIAFLVFGLLVLADQVSGLRNVELTTSYSQNKLYNTLTWLFFGWACHYFPFFLMGRQLFLHHYMPAHMIGALLVAGVVDYVFGQLQVPSTGRSSRGTTVFVVTCVALNIVVFYHLMPLVYGLPLTPEEARAREWRDIVLHYNK